MAVGKLTEEEVLKYAKPIIYKFINKYGSDIPKEQKEEIEQEVYLRLLENFKRIDQDLGWRSFTYNHCFGGVLDYLKAGDGFKESSKVIAQDLTGRKMTQRITQADDQETFDLDFTLGANGIFSASTQDQISFNWDLIARMARYDEAIHATAKWLRGFQIKEIADCFGISRSKTTHLIMGFIERFDSPEYCDDPWFLQTVYAFDFCTKLGIKNIDQSEVQGFPIGWNLTPVDLDSAEKFQISHDLQLSFFDVG